MSKEFKGTPGPWKVGKITGCVVADSNEALTIRGSYENESKDYYGGFLIGESISNANAQLIAAAPELLESLNELLRYAPSLDVLGDSDYDSSFKTAIKKAESTILLALGKEEQMPNKKIVYLAHPISNNPEENLKKLEFIYRFITKTHPDVIPFVPYYATVKSLNDKNPAEREIGLAHNIEMFDRKTFDELWICSKRISAGMQMEIDKANEVGIPVVNMVEVEA